ncbi:MAG: hypothetical protein ACK2UT_07980 [Candidatus Promineifilaceae bacterium]|jgi:hypothetical protein
MGDHLSFIDGLILRLEMVRGGWKSIGRVFLIAIILDLVFQYVVFGNMNRWLGALIAGVVLVIIPNLVLQGPVNRFVLCIQSHR